MMADITVTYEGNTIATMSASGTKTFYTAGKYCDDDITLEYVQPSGGGGLTYAYGSVTKVSDDSYLYVTGLGGTPKVAKFLIDPVTVVGDGTLKTVSGCYAMGASVIRATNNAGSSYGYAAFGTESEWATDTPTVYADNTPPSVGMNATATGFAAKSYSGSYSFKPGYTYNWKAWY